MIDTDNMEKMEYGAIFFSGDHGDEVKVVFGENIQNKKKFFTYNDMAQKWPLKNVFHWVVLQAPLSTPYLMWAIFTRIMRMFLISYILKW